MAEDLRNPLEVDTCGEILDKPELPQTYLLDFDQPLLQLGLLEKEYAHFMAFLTALDAGLCVT